jgi:hypothetical protein
MLVTKRRGALLDGLWEPPGVELEPGEDARRALAAELARLGVRARIEPAGRVVRHTITHRAFFVELWRGELARGAGAGGTARVRATARGARGTAGAARRGAPSARFIDPGRPRVPLTGLAIKLLSGEFHRSRRRPPPA